MRLLDDIIRKVNAYYHALIPRLPPSAEERNRRITREVVRRVMYQDRGHCSVYHGDDLALRLGMYVTAQDLEKERERLSKIEF